MLSVIWIWKASLDFKGYILPLSVQSKNSGESAICIQKGSFTKLVGQKEGNRGTRQVRQNHPNAVGYMETWAPFRVAGIGMLLAGANMAMKPFVKRVI